MRRSTPARPAAGALLAVALLVGAPAHGQPAAPAAGGPEAPIGPIEALLERLAPLLERDGADAALPAGVPFLVRFDGDLRGLEVGAAVEVRGMRVGTVRAIEVTFDTATGTLDAPVLIDVVPSRLTVDGRRLSSAEEVEATAAAFVARGLRAALEGGDPLSGRRRVVLVMAPEAPPARLATDGPYPVLPSLPGRAEVLRATVDGLLTRLAALPIEALFARLETAADALAGLTTGPELRTALDDIVATAHEVRMLATGPEVRRAITDLAGIGADVRALVTGPLVQEAASNLLAATAELRDLAARLDGRLDPLLAGVDRATAAAAATAERAARLVAGLDTSLGPRAPLWADIERLVRELDATTRAARLLVEYLERRPDALIRGRSGGTP